MKFQLLPFFLWIGLTHENKPVFGYYSGFSVNAKKQELSLTGIFNIEFYPVNTFRIIKTLPTDKLLVFLETLSTFLKSGIRFNRAVFIILMNSPHTQIKYICSKIITSIHSGKKPGEAFSTIQDYFPIIFNAVIPISDQTGNLTETLDNLIVFFKTYTGHIKVIRKTLRYPLLILVFVALLYYFILMFVVPSHKELYRLTGSELPTETKILMYVSDFFVMLNGLLIPTVIVSVFVYAFSPKIRKRINELVNKVTSALTFNFQDKMLFVSTLKMLLMSGFNIDRGLLIIGKCFTGKISEISERIRINIHGGMTLTESLEDIHFFGPYFNELIAPAEYTGNIPDALEKIETVMFKDFNDRMQSIVFWLQPLLLILVSMLTVLLLLAVYRPLFNVGFDAM